MKLMSDITVGISSFENSNVTVYPNPFQNDIFVNYTSQSTQNISLKIYSVEGKLVQSKSFVASNGLNKFNISVNDLSSGIYHYSLTSENSTIASGKLVK